MTEYQLIVEPWEGEGDQLFAVVTSGEGRNVHVLTRKPDGTIIHGRELADLPREVSDLVWARLIGEAL